jgi:predicted SAM-dependent methyltransferase
MQRNDKYWLEQRDTQDIQQVTKLNIGCGNNKIAGYWNVDGNVKNKPDQVVDVVKEWPFPSNSITEILFFHAIEHIEEKFHDIILARFHDALIYEGELYISYPEFTKVAENYIHNYKGQRDFWKATIYGLQRYAGDYHVSLMDTNFFAEKLLENGFKDIQYMAESKEEPYNTIIKCKKGEIPISYEDIIGKEV